MGLPRYGPSKRFPCGPVAFVTLVVRREVETLLGVRFVAVAIWMGEGVMGTTAGCFNEGILIVCFPFYLSVPLDEPMTPSAVQITCQSSLTAYVEGE